MTSLFLQHATITQASDFVVVLKNNLERVYEGKCCAHTEGEG